MASSGDVLGGTSVSTNRSGATVSWTNSSNALVDNASAATVAGSFILSHWLHITNFNFSAIPDGSTITGITVKFRRKVSASSNDFFVSDIRLVNSGSQLGNVKTYTAGNFWTTTATIETQGGSSDLWGWTPVLATLKSSTFGVQLAVDDDASGSETASVEVLWMDVTYTPAAGGGTDVTKSMMMMF